MYHPIYKYKIKLYSFETSFLRLTLYLGVLSLLVLLEFWHFVNCSIVFYCRDVPQYVFSHLSIFGHSGCFPSFCIVVTATVSFLVCKSLGHEPMFLRKKYLKVKNVRLFV